MLSDDQPQVCADHALLKAHEDAGDFLTAQAPSPPV
jgi:hypothetical protein